MGDGSLPLNIEALAQANQAISARTAGPSAAQVLLDLARDLTLFHSADGQAYASGLINSRRETWLIPSKPFRMWCIRQFVKDQRKPPPAQALHDVLQVLESQALDSVEQAVFLRVASFGAEVYLDLADERHRVVKITPTEWQVMQDPPVHFIRPIRCLALPPPLSDGSLDPLRELLNLQQEEDWHLLVGWLLGSLRPMGPYPILILQGEQGTAKSTVAKILKWIIDPSSSLLRSAPRNEQDLLIAARHTHVLAFDNLSGLQPWMSDALCRLATGGGFASRELYSDTEEIILHAQRPVILNGIDDLATRHDLIDRAMVLTLPTIRETARRQERELEKYITTIRPSVLGALLTATQTALANLDHVVLPSLPRMADFAVWVTAAEPALGWVRGAFLHSYSGNRGEAIELGLEMSPIAPNIRALIDRQQRWEGAAKDLLELIMSEKSELEQRALTMPKTPQAIRNHLKRLAPALRGIGIEVIFGQRKGGTGQRLITIEKVSENIVTIVTPVTQSSNHHQHDETRLTTCGPGDSGDTRDNPQQELPRQGFPPTIEGLGKMQRSGVGRCSHCEGLTCFAYGGSFFAARMRGQKQTPVAVEVSNCPRECSSKTGAGSCDTIITQRKGNVMEGQPTKGQPRHKLAPMPSSALDHTKGEIEP